jgi:hypothetical protein
MSQGLFRTLRAFGVEAGRFSLDRACLSRIDERHVCVDACRQEFFGRSDA